MKTNILIGALVLALIGIGVSSIVKSPIVNVKSECPDCSLGASSGPNHLNVENFYDGITYGDVYATSTDDTSATLLNKDIIGKAVINFTPNKNGITLTLPATSTLDSFIKTPGSSQVTFICNATTTTGTNADFLLAIGTGMKSYLMVATSTILFTNECRKVTFLRNYRANPSDIDVYIEGGL